VPPGLSQQPGQRGTGFCIEISGRRAPHRATPLR
jgi:hypothetical protein